MVAKMAAENLTLMYLSSAFRYKDKWSVYSYEAKDVQLKIFTNQYWQLHIFQVFSDVNKENYAEFSYVEIFTNSCMFFEMATKMATKNKFESNVIYCSAVWYKVN